jgi:hypothetical protein
VDLVIEKEKQGIDNFGTNAAEAPGEDVGAEQEHGADGRFRERIAEAAGMAADEIALQILQLGWIDADIRQLAEAGVDAIGGFAAGEEGVNDGAGGLDAGEGGGIQLNMAEFERNLRDYVESERLTRERKRRGHHPAGYKVQAGAYRPGGLAARRFLP